MDVWSFRFSLVIEGTVVYHLYCVDQWLEDKDNWKDEIQKFYQNQVVFLQLACMFLREREKHLLPFFFWRLSTSRLELHCVAAVGMDTVLP